MSLKILITSPEFESCLCLCCYNCCYPCLGEFARLPVGKYMYRFRIYWEYGLGPNWIIRIIRASQRPYLNETAAGCDDVNANYMLHLLTTFSYLDSGIRGQ